MLKSIFAAGVVIVSFSTLAIAAPFSTPETSSSVPLLSGNYVITLHKLCHRSRYQSQQNRARLRESTSPLMTAKCRRAS